MRQLFAHQAGLVARRQLLDAGLDAHDVRRMVRRRDLVRVHPGVYINHTGSLSWTQQAWAAVLHHWPAALSHTSALRAYGLSRGEGQESIGVAVERSRGLDPLPGVRLHRVADLEGRVQWQARPPRVRLEEALVDVAAVAPDEMGAIAVLAEAVQARLTTPARIRQTLDSRQRVRRRAFIEAVLDDVGGGVGSVLEHAYLTRVERPHGLPAGERQARGQGVGGLVLRDVLYAEFSQVVELDGRVFHDGARRRDADLGRDLAAAASGLATVRLGWGQVMGSPCRTASLMAELLASRGWRGQARSCGEPLCGRGAQAQRPPN